MPQSDEATLSAKPEAEDFIQVIEETDLPGVEEMYRREGEKYKANTAEAFAWWYFRNPVGSQSLYGVNLRGKIEGFASTNNFYFRVGGERKLVAMIQKVITLPGIRGKGYFGKLLRELEADNLGRAGADILAGFPNGNAAPIYIQKFAYKWAPQLQVKYTPASLLGGGALTRLGSAADIHNYAGVEEDNALVKDEAYYRWRYAGYPDGAIHVLKAERRGTVVGYAFVRTFHKKKIPFFLLMDFIVYDRTDVPFLMKQLKGYALKNAHAGVLYVGTDLLDGLAGKMLTFDTPKKIGFMVKGKSEAETDVLKTRRYNLTFGDMDFF